MIFAVLLLTVGAAALAYRWWIEPGPKLNPPEIVSIEPGDSLRRIAADLRNRGVVRSALAVEIFARLSGSARHLEPGDYKFAGGETVAQVLGHIVRGEAVFVTVTIPEGDTVHQIAQRMQAAGLVCDWEFERAARNSSLVRALGMAPMGVEGYLFPATYRFRPKIGAQQALAIMLARFCDLLTPPILKRIFELGLTPRQLVTLASMVEKEAKVPAERPVIASVFYNRLRLNMPLQSDPTAQYNFAGSVPPVLEAVHTPSAFNTYSFAGLPPGPIANPGRASIEAALYPVATDYLYFVARKDGTHIFSHSLKEHDRAIASLRPGGSNPAVRNRMVQ